MRGTVLVLDSHQPGLVDVEPLRQAGLIVYHCHTLPDALMRLEQAAPDVVLAVLSSDDPLPVVPELRGMVDYATSIIVASVPGARDAARSAGADAFLPDSAPPPELLDRIHRALILRRSGRRLPWA